jgi:hypothetical protein
VTENEAGLIQGHAIAQHLCSGRVTQQVRTFGRSIDLGASESMLHYGRDPVPGGKRSIRGDASNEDVIGIDVGGSAFQIAQQCVADILWERQTDLVSPFPHYPHRAAVPIDVFET